MKMGNENILDDDINYKSNEELPVKHTPENDMECIQSPTIAGIQQILEQISELQVEERKERRESERRIMAILEKLADQAVRITHLESSSKETHEDVDILYDRQRDLEKKVLEGDPRLNKLDTFYSMTTNKFALSLYILFLTFISVDILVNLSEHGHKIVGVFDKIFSYIK